MTPRSPARTAALAALLAGCAPDAAGEAQLLVLEDVALPWDASFNADDDGLVALVPIDAMVYDGASGEPLAGVPLFLSAGADADVVAPEEVRSVDAREGGLADLSGGPVVWDAWRDRYFARAAASDRSGLVDPGSEGGRWVTTDADGLARAYVWVDGFPDEGGALQPIPVSVSADLPVDAPAPGTADVAAGVEDVFLIVPR